MPTYHLGTLHTGSWEPGSVAPAAFADALRARWTGVEVRPTTDPNNPWVLDWSIQIGDGAVTGRLGREYYRLLVTDSPAAVAAIAVWYRSLVPVSFRLALGPAEGQHRPPWIEVPVDVTEAAILERLAAWAAAPTRRVPTPAWRVAPGGHLGNLGQEWRDLVCTVFSTPTDELWVVLSSAGLYRLLVRRGGVWEKAPGDPLAEGTHVPTFVWCHDRLWATAGRAGLLAFDGGGWRPQLAPGLAVINRLAVGPTDTLWVSSGASDLWRSADGGMWEHVALPAEVVQVRALHASADDEIWVVTGGEKKASRPSILRGRGGVWEMLPLPPTRRRLEPAILATDAAGVLWVGTMADSVWRWDGTDWERAPVNLTGTRAGVPGATILGIGIDRQGRAWVAAHGGVACHDGAAWRWVLVAPDPPSAEGVLPLWTVPAAVVHLDGRGRLWMGGRHGGVAWVDTTQPFYNDLSNFTLVEYYPAAALVGPSPRSGGRG